MQNLPGRHGDTEKDKSRNHPSPLIALIALIHAD
jgi:hypothetical protein